MQLPDKLPNDLAEMLRKAVDAGVGSPRGGTLAYAVGLAATLRAKTLFRQAERTDGSEAELLRTKAYEVLYYAVLARELRARAGNIGAPHRSDCEDLR